MARTLNFSKILENKYLFIFSGILFKFILEYTYIHFVNPVYAYAGFNLDINLIKYLEGWLIYFFFLSFTPHRIIKTSDFVINMLFFSFLSPLLVFYSLSNAVKIYLYLILIGVFIIYALRNGKKFKFPILQNGHFYSCSLCILSIIIVSLWLIFSGGLNFFNLDFTRVYEFRPDVKAVINEGLLGYLNSWTFKVFGPFLLVIFLYSRLYFFASLVFLIHIFWFGISSSKSVLFYPFLILFVYACFKNNKGSSIIPIFFTLVILISYLFFIMFDVIRPGSLFIRRVFFVPSFLTFTYYEFFSSEGYIFWSNSITSKFIEYPYDLGVPRVIGDYLGTNSNANNSFLSTGYMHAGIFGIIFYSIIFAFIMRLYDSLDYDPKFIWVSIAIIIIPIRSMITDSDLPTALLTKGVAISLIILFLSRNYFKK